MAILLQQKLEVNPIINDLWLRGLLAVIGETIEDEENEVNGIVLNIRKQAYRVGIWTKDCDESKLKTVGERLKKVLQLNDEQKLNSCRMMLPILEALNLKLFCNILGTNL